MLQRAIFKNQNTRFLVLFGVFQALKTSLLIFSFLFLSVSLYASKNCKVFAGSFSKKETKSIVRAIESLIEMNVVEHVTVRSIVRRHIREQLISDIQGEKLEAAIDQVFQILSLKQIHTTPNRSAEVQRVDSSRTTKRQIIKEPNKVKESSTFRIKTNKEMEVLRKNTTRYSYLPGSMSNQTLEIKYGGTYTLKGLTVFKDGRLARDKVLSNNHTGEAYVFTEGQIIYGKREGSEFIVKNVRELKKPIYLPEPDGIRESPFQELSENQLVFFDTKLPYLLNLKDLKQTKNNKKLEIKLWLEDQFAGFHRDKNFIDIRLFSEKEGLLFTEDGRLMPFKLTPNSLLDIRAEYYLAKEDVHMKLLLTHKKSEDEILILLRSREQNKGIRYILLNTSDRTHKKGMFVFKGKAFGAPEYTDWVNALSVTKPNQLVAGFRNKIAALVWDLEKVSGGEIKYSENHEKEIEKSVKDKVVRLSYLRLDNIFPIKDGSFGMVFDHISKYKIYVEFDRKTTDLLEFLDEQ